MRYTLTLFIVFLTIKMVAQTKVSYTQCLDTISEQLNKSNDSQGQSSLKRIKLTDFDSKIFCKDCSSQNIIDAADSMNYYFSKTDKLLFSIEERLKLDTIYYKELDAIIDILLTQGTHEAIEKILTYRTKFKIPPKGVKRIITEVWPNYIDTYIYTKLMTSQERNNRLQKDLIDFLLFTDYLDSIRSRDELYFIYQIMIQIGIAL